MDRGTDLLDVAQRRVPAFPEEVARLELRVVEDLVVSLNLCAGHAGALQPRYPMRAWPARCHLFDHRDQYVASRVPRRIVLEALIVCPLRVLELYAEGSPVAWSGSADGEVAIGGAYRL